MAENPFQRSGGASDGDQKLYAIESMKNLKYLDYQLISSTMRELAKQKFNDDINDKDGTVAEEEKTVDQDLIDAHIDVTDGILEAI